MPIRVALVDDHCLIRDALSDLIASRGEVDVVAVGGDGAEAVRIASEDRPDVLLLDIALPDGSGLELIDRILASSPATRVLMLSMHSDPAYAVTARKRGASGLISKSAPIEGLLDAIRDVASGDTIPAVDELAKRERQMLTLIAQGATNDEIASALHLRPKTVETYSQQLMTKLSVHTRAGLVGCARRMQL